MESSNCPVRLRKVDQSRSSTIRRSRSTPRGAESIVERSLQDQKIKEFKILQTKQNIEKEQKEKEALMPKVPVSKPFIRQKPSHSIWDDEGHLLIDIKTHTEANNKQEPIRKKQSCMDPNSRKITSRNKDLNRSIMDTDRPSSRTQSFAPSNRRRAPSVQPQRNHFDEFINRQDKSAQKRTENTNEGSAIQQQPRGKFVNKESEQMIKKSNKPVRSITKTMPKRKQYIYEDEYTYKPDMSATRNKRAKGLSCRYSEAQAVLKDIEMTGIKVEMETAELEECTFKPEVFPNEALVRKATRNEEKNNRQKQERFQKVVEEAKNVDDDELKPRKYMRKIPKRTEKLNEMLRLFKDSDVEGKE
ncbi:hypothetical protein TRFO_09216 [Tritrichomonas foetus]|uniref:Uncharacterized protein n=1 Tax=Tritrichomonas foetus TaxID=1144522 RepID=A0A1J4JHR8_9EUKA|nr:hypothetical protein TRFO_09216 [Tritrichomonas foetus]|eukprot:OHS97799.1 hypothetical protein TRFO_09216 [Tritrichomonas foetus]